MSKKPNSLALVERRLDDRSTGMGLAKASSSTQNWCPIASPVRNPDVIDRLSLAGAEGGHEAKAASKPYQPLPSVANLLVF